VNKFSIATIAGISILSAAASVNALADQSSIAVNGVYIGAGATGVVGIINSGTSVDPGATITLGYRVNNNFAVESNVTAFVEAFASGQIIDLNMKGILPVTSKFSVFGKLGAACFHAKDDFDFLGFSDHSSVTRFAPEVGGGVSYNFTPNFATELGASVVPVSGLTIVPVTLGMRYTFG